MQDSCYPNSGAPNNPTDCQKAVNAALNVFNSQSGNVQGASGVTPTVLIVDTATPVSRTTTVTYTGLSSNAFAGVLNIKTFALAGRAKAQNSASPVTTFYMLIDESPSMYFPSTSAGVTTMVNATPANFGHPAASGGPAGGCALGCHEASKGGASFDNLYNPSNVTCSTSATAPFTATTPYFGCVTGTTKDSSGTTQPTILPPGIAAVTASTGTTTTCAKITTVAGTKDNAVQTLGGATTCLDKTGKATTCPNGTSTSFKGSAYFGAEDNYALARCLAVPLRIDLVNAAVSSLMSTAPTFAATNKTTYAVNLYTIDLGDNNTVDTYTIGGTVPSNSYTISSAPIAATALQNIYNWGASKAATVGTVPGSNNGFAGITPAATETQTLSQMNGYFATAAAAANLIAPLETWGNGALTQGGAGDGDSDIDKAGMEALYGIMPAPGKGTSLAGDTPEEVLFIVSDGMNDVNTATANTTYPSANVCGSVKQAADDSHGNYAYYNDYGRPLFCPGQLTTGGVNICTAFKNNKIRIAFLYLKYEPLDPDPDYAANVEPFEFPGNNESGTDEIEQAAIACASPGLEFTVSTDGDITAAMSALFQKAVQNPYLSA